ncbi:MAG TPA: S-methyl-5'-thioinosine phosphorylase [Gammaproteobacteria bacterium]|jgi:5'-methylthioinosine phosphorylase|nr:S-methyl-5'-thioinosine phosphorylase [Gammaproteobacteria bacterium]
MTDLAIIGGTGLTSLSGLEITHREMVYTPYGEPSGPLTHGRFAGHNVVFLARHGYAHTIPPHRVNYRANIWALHRIGVRRVLAIAAVGGIRADMLPGAIAFPDQLIDYTYGRAHTYVEQDLEQVTHVDFTQPYDADLRAKLIKAAQGAALKSVNDGTYAATQGPRLETAAEIMRLERDGCDVVGMTGMPEAGLAREMQLAYACCAVIANWAAGKGKESIHAEIDHYLKQGMEQVRALLEALVPIL